MSKYLLTSTGTLNTEQFVSQISDFKTLYNIEFTQEADNILLVKRLLLLMYEKIDQLESQIARSKVL